MKSCYTFIFVPIMLLGLTACNEQNTSGHPEDEAGTNGELKSVEIRGETLHYLEQGTGEPIILIHGAVGDYTAWGQQMDTLAQKYKVIAISRRYAWPNRQPGPEDAFDCTVAQHAQDLIAFIRAMGLPSTHLIGHSYGAMIALRTAIDYPEQVRSLVLGEPAMQNLISGTALGDSLIAESKSSSDRAVQYYRAGHKDDAMRTFIKMVLGTAEVYDLVPQSWRDAWLRNLVEAICINETKDFYSIKREELKTMNLPTLLISGQSSPAILTLTIDSLHAILPNDVLNVLPNASHGLQGENPQAFNDYVLRFLSAH